MNIHVFIELFDITVDDLSQSSMKQVFNWAEKEDHSSPTHLLNVSKRDEIDSCNITLNWADMMRLKQISITWNNKEWLQKHFTKFPDEELVT